MTRRVFRFNPKSGKVEEVDPDYEPERRAQTATEEIVYGSLGTLQTGVDVSSRTKFREYLKATDSAVASDFSPEFSERVRKERETQSRQQLRETLIANYRRLKGY